MGRAGTCCHPGGVQVQGPAVPRSLVSDTQSHDGACRKHATARLTAPRVRIHKPACHIFLNYAMHMVLQCVWSSGPAPKQYQIHMWHVHCLQVLAYVMQLVGVAVVSVPISWTGMLHYPRQTKIHYSVGLCVQALAFIQVHIVHRALIAATESLLYASAHGTTLWHGALLPLHLSWWRPCVTAVIDCLWNLALQSRSIAVKLFRLGPGA